jgi:hypothetical protein
VAISSTSGSAIYQGGECTNVYCPKLPRQDARRAVCAISVFSSAGAPDARRVLLALAAFVGGRGAVFSAEAGTATGENWNYAKVFVQSMLHYMDAEMVDPPNGTRTE